MPTFECKNCSPTTIPDEWSGETKSKISKIVRENIKIKAIGLIVKKFGAGLKMAKSISLHIPEKKGLCGCKTELIEYEGQCPNCETLNFDW